MAATGALNIEHAAFDAAIASWPGEHFSLRPRTQLLREHPGTSPVYLHVGEKVVRLPPEFNVYATPGLLAELRVLLGPACLWNGGPPTGNL